MGHPPGGYGIWLQRDCAPPTISLWLLPCLVTWGVFFFFFGGFQHPPVKIWEIVKDREAWHSAVHGVTVGLELATEQQRKY